MADVNEIRALQAALTGARHAAGQLRDVSARVEAGDPHADISAADLDELHRLSHAHALAAQALRGLVETMLKRRGMAQEVAPTSGGSDDE